MRFNAAGYWDIEGTFRGQDRSPVVPGQPGRPRRNAGGHGQGLRRGREPRRRPIRRHSRPGVVHLDEKAARELTDGLTDQDFTVRSVEAKPYTRKPYPPFMTSTLQQEAGRKLRLLIAGRTMAAAQRLYERGYITYMRTDSTTLSARPSTPPAARSPRSTAPRYLPDERPHLQPQGQERPGGPRGHPPGGRHLPAPRSHVKRRARGRRVPGLRADLAAHGRQPDDRRPG